VAWGRWKRLGRLDPPAQPCARGAGAGDFRGCGRVACVANMMLAILADPQIGLGRNVASFLPFTRVWADGSRRPPAAGLKRRAPDTPSAAQLIEHEHDEDEMEEFEPSDWELSSKPGCGRCGGKMEGNRQDWIGALTTKNMLKAVAAILITIDRRG